MNKGLVFSGIILVLVLLVAPVLAVSRDCVNSAVKTTSCLQKAAPFRPIMTGSGVLLTVYRGGKSLVEGRNDTPGKYAAEITVAPYQVYVNGNGYAEAWLTAHSIITVAPYQVYVDGDGYAKARLWTSDK